MQPWHKRNYLDICSNYDLEVCCSGHVAVTHQFVTVWYKTMENQRKFAYLNKEARETIKNLCENGVSISAINQICGPHRTNVWKVIKAKTEYRTKQGGRKQKISKL